MLTTRRTATITVETERVIRLRKRGLKPVWCAGCDKQTWVVGADEAALLSCVTARTLYRWIEDQKIHFTETPDGLLMVCLNSISDLKELSNLQPE